MMGETDWVRSDPDCQALSWIGIGTTNEQDQDSLFNPHLEPYCYEMLPLFASVQKLLALGNGKANGEESKDSTRDSGSVCG